MRSATALAGSIVLTIGSATLAAPSLSFEPGEVVVRGLSAGGQVVLFSVSRERLEWTERVVPLWAVAGDAGSRTARWGLDDEPAAKSVWLAVDAESGVAALGSPSGDAVERIASRPIFRWPEGSGGGPNLGIDLEELHLLVVRPGEGAWCGRFSDGGEGDADRTADGRLEVDPSSLTPLDGGGAVSDLLPGDRLFGIAPATLEVFFHEIGSEPLGG